MKKHLVYKQDGSHKFWKIQVSGKSHTVEYGRVGTKGSGKKTAFSSPAEARKNAQKLIDSKLKKGYQEQGTGRTINPADSSQVETSGAAAGELKVNAAETAKFKKEKLKQYVHPYIPAAVEYSVSGSELPPDTMLMDPLKKGRVLFFKGLTDNYDGLVLQTPDGQTVTRPYDGFPDLAVNPLDLLQREHYEKTNLRKEFLVKKTKPFNPRTIKIKDAKKYMEHPSDEKSEVQVYDIIHPCLNLVASKHSAGRDGFGRPYQKASRTWLSYRYDFRQGFIDSLNKDGIDFDTRADALISGARKKINALFHQLQKQPHFGHEQLRDDEDAVELDGKEWRKATSIYDFPDQCKIYPKYIEMQMPSRASYEGVWHMEGLPQEHILMSLLFYEDVSSLKTRVNFKRLYNLPELQHVFWNAGQNMHSQIEDKHDPGYIPLGHLNIEPGELYLFPNSCIHRVQFFENDGMETATRRFWAFFFVDPRFADEVPDPSTVPANQIVSYGDSNHKRELLANMKDRMNFKSKQGQEQPDFHFCEH